MRRSLVAVVVAVVAVIALDQVVEARTQDAIRDTLVTTLGVEDVDVDVSGRPLVLTDLLRGRLATVDITARGVTRGDPPVRTRDLVVDLTGVRLDLRAALGGTLTAVDVDAGTFSFTVDRTEIATMIATSHPGITVELRRGAVVLRGELRGVAVSVTGDAVVSGGDLDVVAREVETGALGPEAAGQVAEALAVRIRLPQLPLGLRVVAAEVTESAIALSGPLPAVLDLSDVGEVAPAT